MNPLTEPQKIEPYDVTKPRKVPYKTQWKVYQDVTHLCINLNSAQEKGLVFWQNRSKAFILHESFPELQRVCTRKLPYHHVHHQKLFWEMLGKFNTKIDCHQRGTSAGKLVADEGIMEPKIDFRIQGISHAAVEQEEDDRIRLIGRLVHQVKNNPNKVALIADLQSNHPYNPFSEESKHMIHNLGNVE